MPQVDVVIPAYNPGRFLQVALDSVLGQTLQDWQAVVVDDGSTEDLSWVDIVDPRVRRLRQDNAGLSAARNAGVLAGSAPLVAFLDADDLWLPRKLARQVLAMGADVGLSSTATEHINAAGLRIGPGFEGHAASRSALLQGNGICVSTVVIRRRVLERVGLFDPNLAQVQDWDLWLRASSDETLVKVPEVLAHYRIHQNNMSANYVRFLRESRTVLRRNASATEGALAAIGLRRVGHLAGAQAFDAFRATRSPVHLAWAFRLNPAYTASAVGHKLLRVGA